MFTFSAFIRHVQLTLLGLLFAVVITTVTVLVARDQTQSLPSLKTLILVYPPLSCTFSRHVQLSLLCLLFGVGIATVTDLELNFLGTCLSLLAILTTCIAQIMTNTIQKRAKLSSTQLLYQTSPVMAATLLLVGPFLDRALTGNAVFSFEYTRTVTVRKAY
jgi:solute carrier family 35 protein E3